MIARGAIDVAAGAPARLTRRLGWGDYRIELNGPGGARTVQRFSAGWGAPSEDAEAPDFVRVNVEPGSHAQGDTIGVAIRGPYGGEAQVAVATDHLIDFKTVTLGANGGVVRLKTDAAWGGGAYVLVSIIQPIAGSVGSERSIKARPARRARSAKASASPRSAPTIIGDARSAAERCGCDATSAATRRNAAKPAACGPASCSCSGG